MLLHGWGRYPVVDAAVQRPGTRSAVSDALATLHGQPLIARGMGRSYGDSALAAQVISTEQLNLLLAFEAATGIVRCSAGTTLADLLDIFVPQGWFLPVTPGTKFITIGGAIASDVHGKNHHQDGCFSEYLLGFKLLLADGAIVTCTRDEHPDLFRATCGGMGLTGIIVEATFRLIPLHSVYLAQTTLKAPSLAQALAHFDAHNDARYSVAWIDCLASGSALGRSLVMLGEPLADGGLIALPKRPITIPCDMPAQLLNRFAIKAFNTLYYHRIQCQKTQARVHYEPFFYPLDSIHHWNRLYGKNGFTQYQFVVPKSAGLEGLSAILRKISASRRGSFLAVLKAFGPQNGNFLSFPIEGYTLALDFKLDHGLFELLEELDAMVLDFGGRLYLTKDARMSEKTFKQSYPKWREFQDIRARYGALGKFASKQSQRLGLD